MSGRAHTGTAHLQMPPEFIPPAQHFYQMGSQQLEHLRRSSLGQLTVERYFPRSPLYLINLNSIKMTCSLFANFSSSGCSGTSQAGTPSPGLHPPFAIMPHYQHHNTSPASFMASAAANLMGFVSFLVAKITRRNFTTFCFTECFLPIWFPAVLAVQQMLPRCNLPCQ